MTWEVVVQFDHLINVTDVSFAPDSRSLATSNADESIKLWDICVGCQSGELRGHMGGVSRVAYGGDGRWLADASHTNTVRIWRSQRADALGRCTARNTTAAATVIR